MRPKAALLSSFALLAVLAPAVHAVSGWHLSRSPSNVEQSEQQAFTLRATDTDGSGDIGCVIVIIPSAFSVQNAVVTGTSTDGSWAATRSSVGSSTRVRVFSVGGAAKLKESDWVEFKVTVTGVTVGSYKWTGDVTQGEDCTGQPFLPQYELTIGVHAGTAPTPTPPPTPAPTMTPKPTATPTPTPRPMPTKTPEPGSTPRATPPGPTATPSVEPGATPSPPGPSPSPTAEPSSPASSATDPGPSAASGGAISAGDIPGDLATLDASGLSAMGFLGDGYAWFVPAFVAGVPGALLIVIVLLQLVGGVMWAPAVRRLRGEQRSRRPRFSTAGDWTRSSAVRRGRGGLTKGQ